uniref:O-methyltransferase C-terminal domain-containing protein n=1 Tax=Chenopodium quinoa TaxID=63459 RepID=A0A803LEE0_CHEQI
MFLTLSDPLITKPWYEFSRSIKEGGMPFVKAHGMSVWEMASKNKEFNNLFNVGMTAATKPTLDAVIKGYKDEFSKLEGTLLVDVGGGTGSLMAEIVEAYPKIKGINFDLPPTVANAPQHSGVTHVGGDMFMEIPSANNVIIKSVLHNWADKECLTILKNCQKAVSQKKGKVIIVDIVLHPNGHGIFDDATIALDLLIMANTDGGKERTEDEWKKLLKEAGFARVKFIPLQTIMSFSVIEAFLQ